MTTDPGAPRTDELARNAALHAIADAIRDLGFSFNAVAPLVAEHLTTNNTVTWETDVNSAGVPVRRYVLRGAWEVNPNPPPAPTSPADNVEWHRHTHEMWVGEGYGAKVLVEVDPQATSPRAKWRARTIEGAKVISLAPLTLARAKHDGVKYLWSRRESDEIPAASPTKAQCLRIEADAGRALTDEEILRRWRRGAGSSRAV